MVTRTKVAAATVVLMAGIVAAWPSPAQAQDHRLRVSFGAATTTGAADSQPALTASVGYRFSQRLSFDIEATGFEVSDGGGFPVRIATGGGMVRFDTQAPRIGGIQGGQSRNGFGGFLSGGNLPQAFNAAIVQPIRGNASGETILATLGLRYEFPVQAGRLLPYVTAGLGAARTDRTVQYSIPILQGLPNVRSAAPVSIRAGSESITHTGLAGSLGVGASLRVIAQLSLDVDARYFRLDGNRSLGRLGGGLSYRF